MIIYIMLATMQISQAQPTTLDPGFANGGVLESPNTNSLSSQATWGIVEMSDGYYLGVGHKVLAGSFDTRATLMKYDICGVPDSAFGTNGLSIISSPSGRRLLSTAAQVLPDGKILVSGASNSGGEVSTWRPTLFRLMPDGSIDSSYGNNGEILLQPGGVSSGNFGNMIKIAGDTLLGAIGRFPNINGGSLGVGLMRALPDGIPDVTFGSGGIRMHSHANMSYSFAEWEQVHKANDSTYLVTRAENTDGGNFRAVMYAFDIDGNMLTTFGTNGRAQHPTTLRNIGSRGIQSIIDSEGRLVIATSDNISGGAKTMVFARYLIDGTLDTTFGDNGTAIVPNTAPTFFGIESRTLDADADGGIIASYISNDGGGVVRSFFIRLDGDGAVIPGSQTKLPALNTGITGLIQVDEDRWLAQAYGSGAMMYQSQLRLSTNPIVLPSIEETGSTLTTTGSGPDFQWFLDGEIIPDATASVYTPTANGAYTVQMTDVLGCQHLSNAFELTELSISENQTASLQLIKNPVEEQLMLQNDLGDMNFEIYNLLGQRVSSGQLINGVNTINVSGLNQGIYLLRTVNEDLSHMKRFMKL
ncbi:T9SS type A sorting domain-containing protein [Paucihalobacter sp.]|uniref:T9SS type A sorting domain-containing protein n=1 Tax=Paucihalobacter sp. TaxID=2850405 RepID=UPI003D160F67